MGAEDQANVPLALPSAETATRTETSSATTNIKLDHLGPLVVNSDGTLSRISNWQSMTEAERERTLRVLGKRNMFRKESLKEEEANNT